METRSRPQIRVTRMRVGTGLVTSGVRVTGTRANFIRRLMTGARRLLRLLALIWMATAQRVRARVLMAALCQGQLQHTKARATEPQTSQLAWHHVTINTTNTLRVEKGQDTWSYTDINSATQTETRSYTNYFDKAGDHVGGVEVLDGETTLWGANWSFVGVEKDISSLGKLTDTTSIAYKLYGDASFDTEIWKGWNGLQESETTYYASSGEKIGSSFTGNNSWTTPDGATVTSTNTSYNDENWNYLGNEWVEGSNGGWNFEKKLTAAFDEPAGVSLDGDATVAETGLQPSGFMDASDITISLEPPVMVREGQDKFSFKTWLEDSH